MNNYLPHKFCILGNDVLIFLLALSNIVIGISYYLIPYILYLYLKRRTNISNPPWVTKLFIVFIALCGSGHFISTLNLWFGWYDLEALVNSLTAIFSLITALTIPFGLDGIFRKTNQIVHSSINKLDDVKKELVTNTENFANAKRQLSYVIDSLKKLEIKADKLEEKLEVFDDNGKS